MKIMNINCINTLIKISIIIVVGACHCKNGDTDQFKLPSVPIDVFRHDSLIGTLQDFTSINSCKCIVFLDGNESGKLFSYF